MSNLETRRAVGPAVDRADGADDGGRAQEPLSSSVPHEGLPARAENDRVPFIALGFALVGYVPVTVFERLVGFGHFGPLAVPAILAMVGVLFAVIGVLRAVDWRDQRALRWSVAAGIIALGRLFVVPFF